MNTSRPGKIVFVAVFVSVLGILFLANTLYFRSVHAASRGEQHASLSLLVPATSSNVNLCRLVLSATILRYPVPVLINWAAPENKAYEFAQHIVKVDTILNYLNILFDRGKKNDLVLIVDGYDVQFQLPPDVLVQRYFKVNEAANKRIERQVGRRVMKKHGLKQSVIFGMDKMCWPDDPRFPQRSGCWAVPPSAAPKYTFGPQTDTIDSTKMRARWLNSGSVMGPVGDVKKVFEATLDSIHKNRTTDSDQFYFANVFGSQEWGRRLLEKDPMRDLNTTKRALEMPNLEKGQKTEFHIGIDYEGALFQPCGFTRSYMTWMKFDGEPKHHPKPNPWEHLLASDDYWDKVLPEDVAGSRAPFSAFSGTDTQVFLGTGTDETRLATNLTWRDVPLGLNSISPHIFPIVHFTGPKYWRERWWKRMWFFPNVEALLKASAKPIFGPISSKAIEEKFWWNEGLPANGVMPGDKGGAVGDKGDLLPWESLCAKYENELFTGVTPPKEKEKKKD